MLKKIFLTILRSALGFILVACLFMYAMQQGNVAADTNLDQLHAWFYFGSARCWVGSVVLTLLPFFIRMPAPLQRTLEWAPLWLPLLYGTAAFLYLGSGLIQ